jgi:hypothetical protein
MGVIDVFYTSGTIQYTPDPYYFLKLISDSKARFKIFNRQSLNVGNKDLWTVQSSRLSWHGGTELQLAGVADREIRYPHVNIALAHFEKIVTEKNTVLYTFEEQSGVQKVNKENIIGKSYVMERKI